MEEKLKKQIKDALSDMAGESFTRWHWSRSVSITSVASAVTVSFLVFIGWTFSGAQWVAMADSQRMVNGAVAEKNKKAIEEINKRISAIEFNTGMTQQATEATKEDVNDIKKTVDKIYDHILREPRRGDR